MRGGKQLQMRFHILMKNLHTLCVRIARLWGMSTRMVWGKPTLWALTFAIALPGALLAQASFCKPQPQTFQNQLQNAHAALGELEQRLPSFATYLLECSVVTPHLCENYFSPFDPFHARVYCAIESLKTTLESSAVASIFDEQNKQYQTLLTNRISTSQAPEAFAFILSKLKLDLDAYAKNTHKPFQGAQRTNVNDFFQTLRACTWPDKTELQQHHKTLILNQVSTFTFTPTTPQSFALLKKAFPTFKTLPLSTTLKDTSTTHNFWINSIFKGILPYQYVRITHLQLERDLQKLGALTQKHLLENEKDFLIWAKFKTCKGAAHTFCKNDQAFIDEKRKSELLPFLRAKNRLASPAGVSKFIYTTKTVAALNDAIKSINSFCFEKADPKTFKKFPFLLDHMHGQTLEKKMQALFTNPDFHEIVGSKTFSELTEFPLDYAKACYKEGRIFGPHPKGTGYKSERLIAPALPTGMIHKTTREDLMLYENEPFQKLYAPANFQFSLEDLHTLEKNIESERSVALAELNALYHNENLKVRNDFLISASNDQFLSLLDFALDHPSQTLGHKLCGFIQTHHKREVRSHRLSMALTWAPLGLGLAVAPYASASIFISAASVLGMTGLGTAGILLERYQNQVKQAEIAKSFSRGELDATQSTQSYVILREKIQDQKLFATLSVALSLGSASTLATAGRLGSKMISKSFRKEFFSRSVELEKLVLHPRVETEFLTKNPFLSSYIADPSKVSAEQYAQFLAAMKNKTGLPFAKSAWPQLFKDGLIKAAAKSALRTVGAPIHRYILKPFIFTPWLYLSNTLLPYKTQIFVYLHHTFKNSGRLQRNLAATLNKGLEEKTISMAQVDDILKQTPTLVRDVSGKVVFLVSQERQDILKQFIQKSVPKLSTQTQEQHEEIVFYIQDLFEAELLKDNAHFKILQENFTRKITSIKDCKALKNVVKFSQKEFHRLRDQFKYTKTLTEKLAYEKKSKEVMKKIDLYFDLAKHAQNERDLRTYNLLAKQEKLIFSDEFLEETSSQISAFDDFDLKYVFKNHDRIRQEVIQFDNLHPHAELYEKRMKQELDGNHDYFSKPLIKNLNKKMGIVPAYKDALYQARLHKHVHDYCAIQNTPVKKSVNDLYKNFTQYVSFTSNASAYLSQHTDKAWEGEDWLRAAYEIFMPIPFYKISIGIFTKPGNGFLRKIFTNYLTNDIPGNFIYGGLYLGLTSKLNSSEALLLEQMQNMLLSEGNVKERMREQFQKHPDLLKKIEDKIDEIDLYFSQAQEKGLLTEENGELLVQDLVRRKYLDAFKDIGEKETLQTLSDIQYKEAYKNIQGDVKLFRDKKIHVGNLPFGEMNFKENLGIESTTLAQTLERMAFHMGYDLFPQGIFSYFRSHITYQMICRMRFTPKASLVSGLAFFVVVKQITDQVKYYFREQTTGY